MARLTSISVLIFVYLAGWQTVLGQETKNDSPESTFKKFVEATDKDDYASLYSSISVEARNRMIFEAVFAMGSGAAGEQADKIMEKYIDQDKLNELAKDLRGSPRPDQFAELYAKAIDDPKGMFVDSYKYLSERSKDKTGPKYGDLYNIKIDGATASANAKVTTTIVSYRKRAGEDKSTRHESKNSSRQPFYFIKSKDKWVLATKNEWQEKRKADK